MVSYRVSLYPPFPSNCLGCMAPSVIKNKGTPQMSSLEVLKRERKYNLSKWPNIQIRSSVQQMNPIYDSSIPCLNYHCIIVTEINIILFTLLSCKVSVSQKFMILLNQAVSMLHNFFFFGFPYGRNGAWIFHFSWFLNNWASFYAVKV